MADWPTEVVWLKKCVLFDPYSHLFQYKDAMQKFNSLTYTTSYQHPESKLKDETRLLWLGEEQGKTGNLYTILTRIIFQKYFTGVITKEGA